jgi:hypothetical protein
MVVVHSFVEDVAVVGDRVGEGGVERVEDAGELVVGTPAALAQLFPFAADRGEDRLPVRLRVQQFQGHRNVTGIPVEKLGQRLGHEGGRQAFLQFQQSGPACVEVVAAGLHGAAPCHQRLDPFPALLGAGVEGLDVGVVGE